MATSLLSVADGNLTDGATVWGVCNSTAELDTEGGNTTVTTSYTRSASKSTGIITLLGVAIKVRQVLGVTGTFSVSLYNASLAADVAGTEVTINMSDFHANATTLGYGGWYYFQFAAPVTLLAATNYQIQCKTSSGSMLNLWTNGTGSNWACQFVTNVTNHTPVATDKFWICGAWTAAATVTTRTITMNETATTKYGSGSTTIPSLNICDHAILDWKSTSAYNPYLKVSGCVAVYAGGKNQIGTVSTPIPANSLATFYIDGSATPVPYVDFGGTTIVQGTAKTFDRTKLAADRAAGGTGITTADSTGWASGDSIIVASTSRTYSEVEVKTLNGAASGTSITANSNFSNAHSGTAPTQAEIGLLTRNILFTTNAVGLFFWFSTLSNTDFDWAQLDSVGGTSTAVLSGVTLDRSGVVAGAGFNMNRCSFSNGKGSSNFIVVLTSSATTSFTNNIINAGGNCCGVSLAGAVGTTPITGNLIFNTGASGGGFKSTATNLSFSNNTITSCGSYGVQLTSNPIQIAAASCSGNVIHSCASQGLYINFICVYGTMDGWSIWRNSGVGIDNTAGTVTPIPASPGPLVFLNFVMFGNTTSCVTAQGMNYPIYFVTCTFNGDTTFATTNGINITGTNLDMVIDNCTFGAVSGIKTALTTDLAIGSSTAVINVRIRNSTLATFGSLGNPLQKIAIECLNGTANNHKTMMYQGTFSLDTAIYDVTPSVRGTPSTAIMKLELPLGPVPVASGASASVTVKVRESVIGDGAAYNGAHVRLIAKANPALGSAYLSDQVLATATAGAAGAFQTLTGTLSAPTDNGVVSLVVDGDGTAGFFNADTVAVV